MNETEKLAKKLKKIYWESGLSDIGFNNMANYFQRIIKITTIKAKIEILEEILTGPDWRTTDKIKLYRDELEAIEKEK